MRLIVKDFSSVYLLDVSPLLFEMTNWELIVSGLHKEFVRIDGVNPKVSIMRSEQLPRKVTLLGSDEVIYGFLLKAHEDTRLDERIMQLFDFISDIVGRSPVPLANRLNITSYRVFHFYVSISAP
jgi:FKBP12-rapamycin complex-associated protein